MTGTAIQGYNTTGISCRLATEAVSDPLVAEFLKAMEGMQNTLRSAHSLGLYPNTDTCSNAQLTPRGVGQLLHLGKHLREAYTKRWKLMTSLNTSQDVLYKSTYYSRTFQSGVAMLYGLIPDFTPGGVNYELSGYLHFCSKKHSGLNCNCSVKHQLDKLIMKEKVQGGDSKLYSSVQRRLSEMLDSQLNKTLPTGIMEQLLVPVCRQWPLPCQLSSPSGVSSKCFDWSLLHDQWKLTDASGLRYSTMYLRQKAAHLSMHPLLHEMAQRMLNVTRGVEAPKFVLFSGHDLTLTPLLVILGINDGKWPPFAARLIIELHKYTNSTHPAYFIRILYNGVDKTRMVKFCDDDQPLCPLENFVYFVQKQSLRIWGEDMSYPDICASNLQQKKNSPSSQTG